MIKRVIICGKQAIQGWCEPGTKQIMNRTFEMLS